MCYIISLLAIVFLGTMITRLAARYTAYRMNRAIYINRAWAQAQVTDISYTHIHMHTHTYASRLRVAYI